MALDFDIFQFGLIVGMPLHSLLPGFIFGRGLVPIPGVGSLDKP
jgi:hypothetical protein